MAKATQNDRIASLESTVNSLSQAVTAFMAANTPAQSAASATLPNRPTAPVTPAKTPLQPAPDGFRITGVRAGVSKNGNPLLHVHVETPGYRGFKGAGSFIVFPQE